MRATLYALATAAAVLAWAVTLRRPSHRPVALALSAALLADLAGEALLAWVLPPANLDRATPPLVGALRWAVYADRALFIVWPAALAALALRVLARRSAWPVAAGYMLAVAVLAFSYPSTRFDVLRQAYLLVELAALAIGVASLVAWHRRSWGIERADITTTIAIVLVLGHLASVVSGPYRVGLFGEAYDLNRLAYLAIFATVDLLQLGALIWEDTSN